MISDSILESDEEGYEEKNDNNRGDPLAKLCILKNEHIPETGEWLTAAVIFVWLVNLGHSMPDFCEQALSMHFFKWMLSVTQSCPSFWEIMCWAATPTPAPCPYQHPQYPSSTLPSTSLSTEKEILTVKWT